MRDGVRLGILGLSAFLFGSSVNPAIASDAPGAYPFERFVGVWQLKEDRFEQVWDGETLQVLEIPGHRTVCARINTDKSILCEVDAVDFAGHILWVLDSETSEVRHLSHFGTERMGVGSGIMSSDHGLELRIAFSDEGQGTYRQYSYEWLGADEYRMISRQYDASGKPTGNWYGGTFERVKG